MGFIGVQPASVPLTADDVPDLPATKITSGTLAVARGGTGLASGTTGEFLKFTGTTTLASAVAGGGKVNQVINASTGYNVTNSTSYVDTSLTASITPSATDSKVLVFTNLTSIYATNQDTGLVARTLRGSTEIIQVETIGGYTGDSDQAGVGGTGNVYLDSPSSTSALTYKVQILSRLSGANVSIGNWISGSERGKSTLTLIEILA